MFRGPEALGEMAVPGPVKCLFILLFYSIIGCNADSTGSFTSGKRFIGAFLQNYDGSAIPSLHIVTYDRPTVVNVSVSNPYYHRSVLVTASSTAVLTLDSSYMLQGNGISKKVITVTSNEDISLIMLNQKTGTADTFLNLPVTNLGTTYYVVTYNGEGLSNEFAIANSNVRAQITITVSGSLVFNGNHYFDKQTFSFAMEPNEAVQFQSKVDLTGTKIVSTKPVAVFSGDECITFPQGFCDHIAVQLYPVDKWSDSFAVFPLLAKQQRDVITIVSAENETAVNIYTNEGDRHVMLQKGSHLNLTVDGATIMNSSKPVMVTYLSTGGSTSLLSTFDSFLLNVIPSANFGSDFAFVTIDSFHNYILVVSPGASSDGITLDGKPLLTYAAENSTFADFTATRIYLGETGDRHVISHYSARFGVYIYGIRHDESYGYSMRHRHLVTETGKLGSLTCLAEAAEYSIPISALVSAGISVADLHLNNPTCRADQKDENWAVIRAPFDSCGTKVINESGVIGYVNTVYGSVPHTPIHRLEIELKCEASTTRDITMEFLPQAKHEAWLEHYKVAFTLYRSASFDDPVLESPYETELNGTLYVQMEVEAAESGMEIFTESCVSAPSLNSNRMVYSIIENGCPSEATFKTYQSNDPRKQRFSFHVFKFEDFPEVYVLCEVVICDMGLSPNRCARGCLSSRQKRDLSTRESEDKTARLSQGPVVFRSDLEGLRHLRLNSEKKGSNYYVPIIGVLSGGCLITILALILQRKYYLRQPQGYMLLTSN